MEWQLLVPKVMELLPRFQAAARTSAGIEATPSGHTDDDETAKGMARLFAEVGEAYVGLIATGACRVLHLSPSAGPRA